jgi:hypothetical protein
LKNDLPQSRSARAAVLNYQKYPFARLQKPFACYFRPLDRFLLRGIRTSLYSAQRWRTFGMQISNHNSLPRQAVDTLAWDCTRMGFSPAR